MENQFEDSSEGSLQLEDFAAIEDLVHRKAGRPRKVDLDGRRYFIVKAEEDLEEAN